MMNTTRFCFFIIGLTFFTFIYPAFSQKAQDKSKQANSDKWLPVRFNAVTSEHKIEIMIGGNLFAEYRYDPSIKKPILFPIKAADGTLVTRGYPLEPRIGEPIDHLHHTGHWLNHGVVNQVDFWASTSASESHEGKVYGAIVQEKITEMEEEGKQGKFTYIANWISDQSDTLLGEKTTFTFAGTPELRIIDRVTQLTAKNEKVLFEDSKEGMMALRVARFLEQPSNVPQQLVGQNGEITENDILNNEGVKGLYRSSDGKKGDDVWGSRAKWVTLASEKDGKYYSVTIMDHPGNVNHPPHWMARGYGLFAVNPLGSAAYTDGKEVLNFELNKGESVTFTYRILIHNGEKLSDTAINKLYEDFKNTH